MTVSFTFIGNATALIGWGPFTLSTDPNFLHVGQRAYLGRGLTSKRLLDPARTVKELPPLDAVVLSHLHGDHWDRVARRGLDRSLPIVTTPHAARRLQRLHRYKAATGIENWESHTLTKERSTVRITSLPGRHAPEGAGKVLPPVMGSLLEFGDSGGDVAHRVYVTGDTLMYDGLSEIAHRYPDIDVAVVHLGGTMLPGGVLVTMDAVQGADLIELVQPTRAVPVHMEDYTVFTSTLADFQREVVHRGLTQRVRVVGRGETVTFD